MGSQRRFAQSWLVDLLVFIVRDELAVSIPQLSKKIAIL
jgi:hypothetical protein